MEKINFEMLTVREQAIARRAIIADREAKQKREEMRNSIKRTIEINNEIKKKLQEHIEHRSACAVSFIVRDCVAQEVCSYGMCSLIDFIEVLNNLCQGQWVYAHFIKEEKFIRIDFEQLKDYIRKGFIFSQKFLDKYRKSYEKFKNSVDKECDWNIRIAKTERDQKVKAAEEQFQKKLRDIELDRSRMLNKLDKAFNDK